MKNLILILFLFISMYILYELTIGLILCKYKYRLKRYKVMARVASRSPQFVFQFSIGTSTGALIATVTANSFVVLFAAVFVLLISLRAALKAYFKIHLKLKK